MNPVFVPQAVRALGRRVVSPTLPRVKAGFQTLYRQCSPSKLARSLPKVPAIPRPNLPRFPKLSFPNLRGKLPSLPRLSMPKISLAALTLPTIKLPKVRLPKLDLPRVRLDALRAVRRRFRILDLLEDATFYTGYALGTIIGLRHRDQPATLFATTASLPEAILLEPMLRALAQRNPEQPLHLWASAQVCDLFSAAPYITKLRNIKHVDPRRSVLSLRLHDHFSAAFGLGKRRFETVICDPRSDSFLARCFTRGARTQSLNILDRLGVECETRERAGRLVRHVPLDMDAPDLFYAINETAERFNIRAHREMPAVYSADTAAQLAHSRSRAWRSEANGIGATSLVAIIPCSEPTDVTIGLGMWSSFARELWSRHKALPILFPEGSDFAAIEQLSSLLGETPHARLSPTFGMLERAAMLARVDAVVATAGSSSQIALAQSIPTVVAGSAYRRRQFTWARHRACYLVADGTGRLSAAEMMAAYTQLIGATMRVRMAV